MPYCACFHNYALDPDGLGGSPLNPEDAGDILPGALGMQDGRASVELLALLKDRLVVRLGSNVDECYALGSYKVTSKSADSADGLVCARYGAALYKAKYENDLRSILDLGSELADFAQTHPRLRSCATVTAPPTSQAKVNLPLGWAQAVAEMLWAETLVVGWKVPPSGAQKNREGTVRGNMVAPGPIQGDVLVIDDTLESGETLQEVGRVLKQAEASKVYALCVTKNMYRIARNSDGSYGIDLAEERWP